jgi:hypothetical protein
MRVKHGQPYQALPAAEPLLLYLLLIRWLFMRFRQVEALSEE